MDTYRKDQELPAVSFNWSDGAGNIMPFGTGWTFTVKICAEGSTTTLATKTTGITGASTFPNVTVVWSASDFTGLTAPATYEYLLYARRTADGLDDVFNPGSPVKLQILPAYT